MPKQLHILGVIPARLDSRRLPGKVLRPICGRPMIHHVYEGARQCRRITELLVATDSPEIARECRARGIPVEMTSPLHPCGSDRVHEVMTRRPADVYVNIQGDEPMIRGAHLDALLSPFGTGADVEVGTLMTPISPDQARDPNTVKVVCDERGRALYFSRWPIPYDRDATGRASYFKHLGLYAYTRAALERFHRWPPSELEQCEKLEQLRFLQHGVSLHVTQTAIDTVGVDTEADLERVQEYFSLVNGH